jgi:hypothetical protein
MPLTADPTAHEIVLPALYATPIVACVPAVTPTLIVDVAVVAVANAGDAAKTTPRVVADAAAMSCLNILFLLLRRDECERRSLST